tara:strand:+ start:2668 stop:2826 length:159 start_codon:yes stop_codon:yes gene_type:complete
MLSSIVFCAGLMLLIALAWDSMQDVHMDLTGPWIALVTGSALGVIVGIKLIK